MLTLASSAPRVPGDTMDSSAIETIRDLYHKCMDRLEWLCSTGLYQQNAWEGEFDRLRLWGQNLEPAPTTTTAIRSSSTLLEDALVHSLPLQNALLEAIEGLYTGLKAFSDAINRSTNKNSFKIAGIDVLSTGSASDQRAHAQAASKYDDVMRRLNNTSRDISNLYNIFDVPARPLSNDRFGPRHSQRSSSSRQEDLYHDHLDVSSDVSPSPMAPPGRVKRPRGDSQSSRDESVYSSSTTYRFSSGSSERMTQELPSIHSFPAGDGYEQSPYESHTAAAPRVGPYYGPPAGLQQHPQHTSVYPIPPKSPYVSYTPSRSLHDVRSHESLSEYREQDQLGSLSPSSDRAVRGSASRSMGRLRMPLDPAEDSNSTPKLTKTGRVSKALRGEPVHACNICDKVYTRAEHLRRHRASHRSALGI